MPERQETRLSSSSEAITWLTGSCTVGPGRISSRVVSESPAAAGVWLKETYWLSGVCLLRVAVFTAGVILGGVESSGEVGEVGSRAGGGGGGALLRAGKTSLIKAAGPPPGKKKRE